MLRRRAALAAPFLLPLAARAQAPDWPQRPIRIIVPYPPGGSTDVLARAFAAALPEAFPGASIVVDNRPGGAAVVGTQAAAQAAPDGYTLCLSTNQTHAANPAMIATLAYDPVADFAAVARLATVHHALVVPASGPARSLEELASRGRGRGSLAYASSGAGSASHVIAETFIRRFGLNGTHVPYRGGAQATTDTIAGQVAFFVSTWPQVVSLVREGRLRALGIGAPARLPEAPEVPTFAELGAPYLAVDAWFGLWAPTRTPAAIVGRLSAATATLLARPPMVERLQAQGFVAAHLAATEFAAFQRDEISRWKELVEITGIKLEG